MLKNHLFCVALAILFAFFSLNSEPISGDSANPDDPLDNPNRELFDDVDSLADFFESNREFFDDILGKVEDNQKMFCIDTWWGEAELLSGNGETVRKEDIAHYDELLLTMEHLSMTRIDYYNQDPTQIQFSFSSSSLSPWSLYITYGVDIVKESLDESIDLGDSWLVYGAFHG